MKDIRELLNGILDAVISEENRDIPPLFSSWKEVAGEDCAAHSRIIDYVDGILVIGVDHPGWTQIILSRRKRILSGLRKRFPRQKIESIRMVLKEKGKDEWPAAAMPAGARPGSAMPIPVQRAPAAMQQAPARHASGAAANPEAGEKGAGRRAETAAGKPGAERQTAEPAPKKADEPAAHPTDESPPQPSAEPGNREGFDNLLSRLGRAIEERDRER